MKGGYRAGAGRKKGFAAKNAEEARRVLSRMVEQEIRPIGEALIARAKSGDVAAAREVLDRAFGKAMAQTVVYDESKEGMEKDRAILLELVRNLRGSDNKQPAH